MDCVSYHASKHAGESLVLDAAYVDSRLAGIAGDDNLARYILEPWGDSGCIGSSSPRTPTLRAKSFSLGAIADA